MFLMNKNYNTISVLCISKCVKLTNLKLSSQITYFRHFSFIKQYLKRWWQHPQVAKLLNIKISWKLVLTDRQPDIMNPWVDAQWSYEHIKSIFDISRERQIFPLRFWCVPELTNTLVHSDLRVHLYAKFPKK